MLPKSSTRLAFHAPDRDALDAALLAQISEGDADAFRTLFDAYASPLVMYGASILGATPPAEDVAHELFAYVWTHRYTLDVVGTLRTYLYRATRNRCYSVLRHERVKHAMEEATGTFLPSPAPPASADAELDRTELSQAIERAVAALPDRAREVWKLNRDDQLTYAEIARVLGISPKTVETHMGRALKTLRLRLADWQVR
jgi:RNA polymerase sigma-70 factor (ECF subfamily)